MGISHFDVVRANAFVGGGVGSSYPVSPFGTVWYVDGTNGSDGNVGTSPSQALLTIAQAITNSTASKGDHIVIAPGTYTITAALVPKAQTVFRAAHVNARAPSVTITGNIADLVQVDVSGCVFVGIEFKASGATVANLVDVADGGAVTGLTFDSCVFNGADQTTVDGLNLTDGTNATIGLVVKNCLFRDLTGTGIDVGVLGMPYALVQGSQFAIDVDSGVGIALADTTAFATGKGYAIVGNLWTGFDATADEVGITIAGTENTTGAGIIADNRFAYMAAASVTIDKLSLSEVQNYYGDAATGGTLVDPGT